MDCYKTWLGSPTAHHYLCWHFSKFHLSLFLIQGVTVPEAGADVRVDDCGPAVSLNVQGHISSCLNLLLCGAFAGVYLRSV